MTDEVQYTQVQELGKEAGYDCEDGLCLADLQELSKKAGYDWDLEEQKAVGEIRGPTGTYDDLPEWQQCDLIDALEAEAIEYLTEATQ